MPPAPAARPETGDELRPILDEELERLPEKYRVLVVLCYLEGKTYEETAAQLGWKRGTVSGRLVRARRLLGARLARRGVTLASGALAPVLAQNAALAAVPPTLVASTVKAATLFAAGKAATVGVLSAKVAALAEGVLQTLLIAKVKVATAVLLVLSVLGAGAGVLTYRGLAGNEVAGPTGNTSKPTPEAAALRNANPRLTLTGHQDWVMSVAFSPDGRRALTGSRDKTVRLWDVETGKELQRFVGHGSQVWCVAFSPDGRQALSASGAHLQAPGFAVAQPADCVALLWDVETGKGLRRFEGHTNYVLSVAFSPDGKQALTGSLDQTARLWDVGTGKERDRFLGNLGAVYSIAYGSAGHDVLFGLDNASPRRWDLETRKEKRALEGHANTIRAVAVSKDGRWGLSGSVDKTVRLWDLATNTAVGRFEGHTSQVMSVAISAHGRLGVSGGEDKTVRLWDLATGNSLGRLAGHTAQVNSVALSPDGRQVLSGGADQAVYLWDVELK